MNQTIACVDAFTDRPFLGNPAAVVVTAGPVDETWMKQVAREMNLSETAFAHRVDGGGFSLRWLTPSVEVDLCGHATLATAHLLWEDGHLDGGEVARFQTRSGELTATRGLDGWISLDLPELAVIRPARREEAEAVAGALGSSIVEAWMGRADMLVEVPSEAALKAIAPDFARLRRFAVRGVIATSRADDPTGGYDFASRFFAPAVGVDEDPVTGSAHCALAPYWSARLDKSSFVARQVSARGGTLRVETRGGRVLIAGQAVTVYRGTLAPLASPPG